MRILKQPGDGIIFQFNKIVRSCGGNIVPWELKRLKKPRRPYPLHLTDICFQTEKYDFVLIYGFVVLGRL